MWLYTHENVYEYYINDILNHVALKFPSALGCLRNKSQSLIAAEGAMSSDDI